MYYYSTQATLWDKKQLLSMFRQSKAKSIRDESYNSTYLKNINAIGMCYSIRGEKIGGHYNSTIFPYIATGIVRGKWNTNEYSNELNTFFYEFDIDKNIRGTND